MKEYKIPIDALRFLEGVSYEPIQDEEDYVKAPLTDDQVFRLRCGWYPIEEITE